MSELESILSELLETANNDSERAEKLTECSGQTIQLKVSDGDDLIIVAKDNKLALEKGSISDPTATVLGETQAFVDLFNQELDAMGAVMSGKLVLKGDVTPFMELELF